MVVSVRLCVALLVRELMAAIQYELVCQRESDALDDPSTATAGCESDGDSDQWRLEAGKARLAAHTDTPLDTSSLLPDHFDLALVRHWLRLYSQHSSHSSSVLVLVLSLVCVSAVGAVLLCWAAPASLAAARSMFPAAPSLSPAPAPPQTLVTVVTSFYPAPTARESKHSMSQYDGWLANFLTHSFHQQTGLFIYTSPAFYARLALLRYNLLFHNLTLADLTPDTINHPERINKARTPYSAAHGVLHYTWWNVDYSSPFELPAILPIVDSLPQQHAMDAERDIHSPFLYAVWNAKPWCVAEAAKRNVFGSEYFMWMDSGSFRGEQYRLPVWPDERRWKSVLGDVRALAQLVDSQHPVPRVVEQPILYGVVSRKPYGAEDSGNKRLFCNESSQTLLHLNMTAHIAQLWTKDKAGLDFVEGTYWAGSRAAVAWYAATYYSTIHERVRRGGFVGIEQETMSGLVLTYPEHFLTFQAYQAGGPWDRWFYMPSFFASADDVAVEWSERRANRDSKHMLRLAAQVCEVEV